MSVIPTQSNPRVRELVRRLDDAMAPPDDAGRVHGAADRRRPAGRHAARLGGGDDPLSHLRAGGERLAPPVPRAQVHRVSRGGEAVPGLVVSALLATAAFLLADQPFVKDTL